MNKYTKVTTNKRGSKLLSKFKKIVQNNLNSKIKSPSRRTIHVLLAGTYNACQSYLDQIEESLNGMFIILTLFCQYRPYIHIHACLVCLICLILCFLFGCLFCMICHSYNDI